MGKWAHRRLGELGATLLHDLGLGNDDEDLAADFEQWCDGLWPALATALGADTDADDASEAPPEPRFECRELASGTAAAAAVPTTALEWLSRALPKQSLYECAVRERAELTPTDPSGGSVVHLELDCQGHQAGGSRVGGAATLAYEAADDLGVCCDNGAALADRLAERLGVRSPMVFDLVTLDGAARTSPPLPTPCTVEQALRYYADVRAPAGKPLLRMLAAHTTDGAQAARLRHLASTAGRAEYAEFVSAAGRGVLDLLDAFPTCCPPLGALLELVPRLTPRYYTISSSPAASAGTRVAMTVKVLREPHRAMADRLKEGICSTQLGALPVGAPSVVFVRPSAFRLPTGPGTPMLMIGPGTGIAPFRALLQEISARREQLAEPARAAATARETVLYFGCRNAAVDFLYRAELEAAEAAGTLTRLRVAFSRDGPSKVYVQHCLAEDGAHVHALLQAGAHVYVCGGTSMGREVVGTLADICAKHGGLTRAQADDALKQMASEGRLIQELWS